MIGGLVYYDLYVCIHACINILMVAICMDYPYKVTIMEPVP